MQNCCYHEYTVIIWCINSWNVEDTSSLNQYLFIWVTPKFSSNLKMDMKISSGLSQSLIDTCRMEWKWIYLCTEWWTSTEEFLIKEKRFCLMLFISPEFWKGWELVPLNVLYRNQSSKPPRLKKESPFFRNLMYWITEYKNYFD